MAKSRVMGESGPTLRLLRKKEVAARLGVTRWTVWRMVRDGQFPKPIEVSPGVIAFIEHEVVQWITERMKARPRKE